jgi:hypothetical protein
MNIDVSSVTMMSLDGKVINQYKPIDVDTETVRGGIGENVMDISPRECCMQLKDLKINKIIVQMIRLGIPFEYRGLFCIILKTKKFRIKKKLYNRIYKDMRR